MPKKTTLMTPEELQMLRYMDIPPKRGTLAYAAMQDAIQEAKDKQLRERMEEGYEGAVKKKKGGKVKSSASKRADGIAKKGKTRGKMV